MEGNPPTIEPQGWKVDQHMARLTVSCIIPVYNMGRELEGSIRTAWLADEILVINDFSTDGTDFDSVVKWYKHARVIHLPHHSGVVQARNRAINEASSDLILPLDADDWLFVDAVETLTNIYEPGHFVYGDWVEWDGGESEYKKAPPIGMIGKKNVAKATFLFSREDALKVGGYNPDFEIGGEDWAFMLALLQAGVKPIYVNKPILNYTKSNTGRAAKTFSRRDEVYKRLREHYGEVMNAV